MQTTPDPLLPQSPSADTFRQAVRNKYGAVARGEALSCCGPAEACAPTDVRSIEVNMIGDAYDGVDGYVDAADLRLGCGLPIEHARLTQGQTVLDLGSGAGLDAFVARRVVGETGTVLGVDFTPEMVEKARKNAAALGYANVRFEHGDIEALPFNDGDVDVVVSNCVLNLVPDKARAFAEAFRVLRPGGHVCISDVVSRGVLPDAVRASAELYAGCVAGAVDLDEYLAFMAQAGFVDARIVAERPIGLPDDLLPPGEEVPLFSITVRATRPASESGSAVSRVTATLRVYDPPQCCSTGVCGPDVDPALVQFASDLRGLASSGITVERFNLAQQPEAFVREPVVVQTVNALGTSVLPLLVVDGRVVSHGRYPSRNELLAFVSTEPEPAFSLQVAAATCCAPGSGGC